MAETLTRIIWLKFENGIAMEPSNCKKNWWHWTERAYSCACLWCIQL